MAFTLTTLTDSINLEQRGARTWDDMGCLSGDRLVNCAGPQSSPGCPELQEVLLPTQAETPCLKPCTQLFQPAAQHRGLRE